ncbi:zinc finger MYM-type protein 1-like protein [Tanacetum coccineum]
MPPKPLRKQESRYQKRLKKQKTEESNKKQFGTMHKYVIIEPRDSYDNQDLINDNVDGDNMNAHRIDDDNVDGDNMNVDGINVDNVDDDMVNVDGVSDTNVDVRGGVHGGYVSVDNDDIDDINLESTCNDDGTEGGPKRDNSFYKGPKDKICRQFSATFYTRVLPNREKCDREWLVYSKELDRVFCFCCKIFRKGVAKGALVNEGFADWTHLSTRLKEHEVGLEHITNMATWFDMHCRVKKNEAIDNVVHEQFEKERYHWMKVLLRIISIVKFLAKHNLAFRGTTEKLFGSD